ncbi:hypothetical protein STEG23_020830, partial [Scotinomys teguina]
ISLDALSSVEHNVKNLKGFVPSRNIVVSQKTFPEGTDVFGQGDIEFILATCKLKAKKGFTVEGSTQIGFQIRHH